MGHPAVTCLPPNQEKEEHDTTEASDPMNPREFLENTGTSIRRGSRPMSASGEVIIHISKVSFSQVCDQHYISSHNLSRLPIPQETSLADWAVQT